MDLSEEREQTAKVDFDGTNYGDGNADNLHYYANCQYSLTLSAAFDGFLLLKNQDSCIKLSFPPSSVFYLGQAKKWQLRVHRAVQRDYI